MQSLSTIQLLAVSIIPGIFAITVHEAAHGWVASKLGDKTALLLGRVTLNPIKHIDPLGTIVLPAMMVVFTGMLFGWAKPVPINVQNLGRPNRDMVWVALAGPMANLCMALGWAAALKLSLSASGTSWAMYLEYMSYMGILINLLLMFLNLLPLPPLDGSRVLRFFIPDQFKRKFDSIERYGFIVLAVLLMSGVLSKILLPLINSAEMWIRHLIGV